MIEIDIENRILQIVGANGERVNLDEVDKILANRKKLWKPRKNKYESGILKVYSDRAVSPMKGGYME